MAGVVMGRRRADGLARAVVPERDLLPGDFYRTRDGVWYVRPPAGSRQVFRMDRTVTEHPDGSISCEVFVADGAGRVDFHGRVRRGLWRWGTP